MHVIMLQQQTFCAYTINYTVILEKSTGEIVEQRVVTSDSCRNGLCSTNFTLPADQNYIITVKDNSLFGQSDVASIDLICTKLTTANQVLLAIAVVVLCAAIVCMVIITKKGL